MEGQFRDVVRQKIIDMQRFPCSRFYNDLRAQGIAVAKDTLHEYLGHLQDAFLIHTVPMATTSERQRMVNPRKAYPADPALTPVFDRSGRANRGHALETVALLALLRRGAEVFYVRTRDGYEVDFLARWHDGTQSLIQVCAELDDQETRAREVRALEAAALEYPEASRVLVTLTPETAGPLPPDIVVHAAEAWLLDDREERA